MESEHDCLQAFAVHGAWAHEFPDCDPPGYTRTSVLRRAAYGAQTVSRRIDRNSVSHGLLGHASSMFTTLVGFSDHNSVVLQFVGLGLDGSSRQALQRLMQQARESRIYGVLKARSGHLLRDCQAIAREPVAY